jgi:hypothetical protein
MSFHKMPNYSKKFVIRWVLFGTVILLWAWFGSYTTFEQQIDPRISQQPIQLLRSSYESSTLTLGGIIFDIQTVGGITLWGIITSISDQQTVDKYNMMSVCVMWGDNVSVYKEGKYTCWHDKGQCMLKLPNEYQNQFEIQHFSNNHLLLPTIELQQQAKLLNVGDQIVLSGSLVNIKKQGTNDWLQTSIVRDDIGDGACEIIIPENIKLIKQDGKYISILIHIIFLIISLIIFYINIRKSKKINFYEYM